MNFYNSHLKKNLVVGSHWTWCNISVCQSHSEVVTKALGDHHAVRTI